MLVVPPGQPAHVGEVNPEAQTSDYSPPELPAVDSHRHVQLDDDGLLATATFGDGSTVEVARDGAGRPTAVTTPRGVFTYGYTPTGHLDHLTTPEGTTTRFTSDGPLPTGMTLEGPVTGAVSWSYDADLRPIGETVNGVSVGFAYDTDDLLVQTGAMVLQRDAASGLLSGETLGALSWSFSRNAYGEMDQRVFKVGSLQLWWSQVLGRDSAGRILSRRETVQGELHDLAYSYDVIGRLTDVTIDGAATAHYEYDDNGNRLLEERDGQALEGRHDAQDRLSSYGGNAYTYTADGALESKTYLTSGATTFYRYDLASNLLGVTLPSGDELEYVVDAEGQRIARKLNGTVTHRWVYGSDAGPAAEVDEAGNVVTRFVYANSWVPAHMVQGGRTYALVTDAVGSVRLVVDAVSGEVAQRLDYDAFGRVLADSNPGFQPFGFGGGIYDSATGLVRLGARDYDAEVGRWTTKDPIGFDGGDTNLYGYVGSAPIERTDPTGLDWRLGDGPLTLNYLRRQNYSQVTVADIANSALIAVSAPTSPFWALLSLIPEGHLDPRISQGIAVPYGRLLGKGGGGCSDRTAYSTAFETRLSPSSFPGVSRGRHFQEANEHLLAAMEKDAEVAAQMSGLGIDLKRTPTGLAPRTPPEGWTWHHEREPGLMRLVPHDQHSPGSSFWDVLHPGGVGGYALWGK